MPYKNEVIVVASFGRVTDLSAAQNLAHLKVGSVMLSAVSAEQAKEQIGTRAYQSLRKLGEWLYEDNISLSFRVAPSLVARSEAELLGVSSPRFAYRCYFGCGDDSKNYIGFVNARRLEQLSLTVPKWGERNTDESLHKYANLVSPCEMETPAELLKKQPCIGDSLLRRPNWLEEYHILEVDLGPAYGEGESFKATPYVQHMQLGGMCAQAVCQMTVLLCEQYVKRIHGIAEISAIAGEKLHQVGEVEGLEFDLGGMKPHAIAEYLSDDRVDLQSRVEVATSDLPSPRGVPENPENIEKENFRIALRSYLLSGFPVILPVDAGRLRHLEDHSGRNLPDPILSAQPKPLPQDWCQASEGKREKKYHAVLAIGCANREDQDEKSWRFVINDPSSAPFLVATLEQLVWSRPYGKTGPATSDNLSPLSLVSVTPSEVRLSLMNPEREKQNRDAQRRKRKAEGVRLGLFAISDRVAREAPEWDLPYLSLPVGKHRQHEFSLIHLSEKTSGAQAGRKRLHQPCSARLLDGSAREGLEFLVQNVDFGNGWYWLEYREEVGALGLMESVWIWDAQQPPPAVNTAAETLVSEYLVAVAKKQNGQWTVSHTPAARVAPPGASSPESDDSTPSDDLHNSEEGSLSPSVITSFTPRGIKHARENWPPPRNGQPIACELYAFMESDSHLILNESLANPRSLPRIVQQMAFVHREKDDTAASDCAKEILKVFPRDRDSPGIVALASFVPEVMARPGTDEAWDGQDALAFLYELSKELQQKHRDLACIEIVAGSRTERIFPGSLDNIDPDRTRYFVTRLPDQQAQERLVSRLQSVADKVKWGKRQGGVVFCLEAEPGPLFVLRDEPTMNSIAGLFAAENIDTLFLFNADISHWLLCGIDPANLSEDGIKVGHVHVSKNHPKAHFGDIPLGKREEELVLSRWFKSCERLVCSLRDQVRSSQHASLELEAAKYSLFVSDSMEFFGPTAGGEG